MARSDDQRTLHLVASSGGHLELIVALLPFLADYRHVWITTESNRARNLEASGDRLETVSFYGRNPLRLIRHFMQVISLIGRDRPRAVITTGAGTAVPYSLIARLLGANVIFIETMARVTNASISGRILSRLASTTIVQWPEMLNVYRSARLCNPALLRDVNTDPHPAEAEGNGTFVAVGTHFQSFDRLLSTADQAIGRGTLPKPATGQSGASTRSAAHLSLTPFMSPDAIERAMVRSRYVVCHAGSGMISSALRAGRRPLVMPRLRAHGEHVDDHQLQIVEKLGAMNLVVPIEGEITASDVAAAEVPLNSALLSASGPLPSIDTALADALRTIFATGADPCLETSLDSGGGTEAGPPTPLTEKARTWT